MWHKVINFKKLILNLQLSGVSLKIQEVSNAFIGKLEAFKAKAHWIYTSPAARAQKQRL